MSSQSNPPLTVNDAQFDRTANQKVVDAFQSFGFSNILSYPAADGKKRQASLAKTDTLLSLPMDSILDRYGYMLYSYILYYETLLLLRGEDAVAQVFYTKKGLYNWSEETFNMLIECVNGDAELAFP